MSESSAGHLTNERLLSPPSPTQGYRRNPVVRGDETRSGRGVRPRSTSFQVVKGSHCSFGNGGLVVLACRPLHLRMRSRVETRRTDALRGSRFRPARVGRCRFAEAWATSR